MTKEKMWRRSSSKDIAALIPEEEGWTLGRQNQQMSSKMWGVTPSIFILYLEVCYALYRLSNKYFFCNRVHPMIFLYQNSNLDIKDDCKE